MAITGKGVKGKEALHVVPVFFNFERGFSFRGLSFRDTLACSLVCYSFEVVREHLPLLLLSELMIQAQT